jgi:hypothetical protein
MLSYAPPAAWLARARAVSSACVCLSAANQQVAGAVRSWVYNTPEQSKSLYLRPHVTPPSTLR